MTDDTKGGLTVRLDGSDIRHLTQHGTSVVRKEIGPIEVKVKCEAKVYPRFVMDEPNGGRTEIFNEEEDK